VDAIASARGARWAKESKFAGWVARVGEGGRDFWLLKPATYMNESGRSVGAFLRFHRIEPRQMLVVHDELDLPPGTARFKLGGGHGGHNGLRDTITHCGADFWRLRLGIGHPGDRGEVIDYVLQRAAPADEEAMAASLSASLEALTMFVGDGAEKAMKFLHTQGKQTADNG
jgi:PTH1 family peptidyl-tRNA hydrolase